ncbi:MAG: hypothetical protein KF893_24520 [Caldilineaceae bacterium]|nr:hypothetical protein [Caldilineaceae bacterium]
MIPEIYQFQRMLSRRLLIWSGLSILVGLWLTLSNRDPNRRGFAQQAAAWGAINAAIAVGGRIAADRRAVDPRAHDSSMQQKEAQKLRRLLWFNAALDVFYVIGGLALAHRPDPDGRGWYGHGWGIIVQGFFLFWFDLYHALALADE